jgi:hypothetical protein
MFKSFTRMKGHRIRFGLRALLIAIAVFGIWLGWNVQHVRKRQAMETYVKHILGPRNQAGMSYGPPIKPWKSVPIMWRILGARSVQEINLQKYDVPPDDQKEILKWFPEANVRF